MSRGLVVEKAIEMQTTDFLLPLNEEYISISRQHFSLNKFIEIDSLHPNQLIIDEECLKRKIKGENLSTVYVVRLNGRNILLDGHHTVIAKKIKGLKKVKCKFHIINPPARQQP